MKKLGDGTRVLNFLVDTLLYWILAILLYKWWNFHVLYWGYMHLNFGWFFFVFKLAAALTCLLLLDWLRQGVWR